MQVIPFLICFPLLVAVLMYCIRADKVRNVIAYAGAVIIIAATAVLVAQWMMGGCQPMELYVHTEMVNHLILAGDFLLMIVVTFLCFRYKKYLICLLSIAPTILIAYVELAGPALKEIAHIRVDYLSILMCIIVGVIGSLIVVYAVGYMDGYHKHHTEFQDRKYYFFMVLFLFLGAMFGFVLSNSLLWLIFFWETTSVCSFLLIGYTRETEAINNSFRALWMNLLGGCALSIGVTLYIYSKGQDSLQELIRYGKYLDERHIIAFAVALIAFAALTKAAQMPFSTWLMGAMVAPTPSSALLHSATMVKAGIYILFRLGPAMSEKGSGNMIAFIGGFTFFAASVMAIAQHDGKKVLAFSTISNLGLMVACAGVGRAETIWAGVFLMIFHAISKSLLFQDIGATENATHSREIESMHGLLYRVPRLAIFMFIGIVGMFLAPFGMLISKWSALRAAVDESNIMLVVFIVFGSATTSYYWTKWLGKIISPTHNVVHSNVEDITQKSETLSMSIHAFLMIALCVLFPVLSVHYVEPLLIEQFGHSAEVIPTGVLYTLIVIICLVFLVPFLADRAFKNRRTNVKLAYMNGVNVGNNTAFVDSLGNPKQLWMSNYYFTKYIGQKRLMFPCQLFTLAVLIIMLARIMGGVF